MGEPTSRMDAEVHADELLAHAGWLHGLAARLVRDPERAADVVQDTWLVALERPPRGRGAALRRWLGAVARNLARRAGRDAAVRALHEGRAARPEGTGAEERLRLQRLLADTLLGLEEPYRSAVVLRYLDGLPAREIARRQGTTPEATRQRLSRGLAQLRARLDREFGGDRAAWCALVAGSLPRRGGGAGGVGSGTAVGSTKGTIMVVKLSAAVLGSLTLLLAWALLGPGPGGGPGPTREGRATGAQEGAADAPTPRGGGEARAPLAAARAEGRVLHGVVTDGATGAPVAGAVLHLSRSATRPLGDPLFDRWPAVREPDAAPDRWWVLAEGRYAVEPLARDGRLFLFEAEERLGVTDAAGRFRVRLPEGGTGAVERAGGARAPAPDLSRIVLCTHPRFLPHVVQLGTPRPDRPLRVALRPPGRLHVRVVDPAGDPIPGVRLRAGVRPGPEEDGVPLYFTAPASGGLGPTDAAGEARIGGFPTGCTLFVQAQGAAVGPEVPARIDALTGTGSVELVARRLGGLRGRLVHADGTPAAGVAVRAEPDPFPSTVRTGEGGEFELERLVAGPVELAFEVAGAEAVTAEVPPGAVLDLGDFVLPGLAPVEGRVLAGELDDPAALRVRLYRRGRELGSAAVDPDGRFAAAAPPGELVLAVEGPRGVELGRLPAAAPGRGLTIPLEARLGAVAGELGPGEGETLLVLLSRVRLPRGYATGLADRPARPGEPAAWLSHGAARIEREEGRFARRGIAPGRYGLWIQTDGLEAVWLPEVEVRAGTVTELGELRPSGARLCGRVLDTAGIPAAGARVVVEPAQRFAAMRRASVETGPDGRFELEWLQPGPHRVHAELGPDRRGPSLELDVAAGAALERELVLAPPGRIRGRVTRGGAPLAGAVVALNPTAAPAEVCTGPGGSYAFECQEPGEYAVVLSGPASRLRFTRLEPGTERTVDFELQAEPLPLRFLVDGRPVERVTRVELTALDPGGPWLGARRTARGPWSEGAGVPLEPFPVPALVRVAVEGDATHWGVLGASAREAELATGELRVRLAPGSEHAPPPRLLLLEVPAGSVEEALGEPAEVPGEPAGPGQLRFRSIPAGARLRLAGAGGRAARELTHGGGVLEVPWP